LVTSISRYDSYAGVLLRIIHKMLVLIWNNVLNNYIVFQKMIENK